MVYQVGRSEVKQEVWDEMKKIVEYNVCSVCGAELQIHTIPESDTLAVGCLNKEHHGYIERETWTQSYRRGEAVPLVIQDAIEKKLMPKDDLGRAMNLLALRYPRSIENPESAALFIMDCARLDLDPLIQPSEAVPVTFKSRKKNAKGEWEEKVTVAMIITGDGWLSMAARGCKEEFNGPPTTMRLEEYLMSLKENEGRTRKEIQAIARDIKESECKDPEAWAYVAKGRSKAMTDDAVVYGFFTHQDLEKAEKGKLPAFDSPGNQARVRARKKFIREVYPDCRQRMIGMSKEWYQRSEGIQAAQEFIDAEYRIIEMPDVKHPAPPTGDISEIPDDAEPEGDGFSISLQWLKESQSALKWTDETLLSFLTGEPYKVSGKTVREALGKLSRELAEKFVEDINSRAEKQQGLFE